MSKINLKQNIYPGLFIDIEGPDGCGASTQIALLKKWLVVKGVKVFNTKEPTDNVIGGLIRGALTRVYSLPLSALQLLFVADRIHHLHREVTPILKKKGRNVLLTDRYLWSTVAFGAVNLDRDWLIGLHRDCYLPDITIFLKVSPKVLANRLKNDRFDLQLFERVKTLKKVWQNYEWLAKKFRKDVFIVNVDGDPDPEKVFQDIMEILLKNKKFKKFSQ